MGTEAERQAIQRDFNGVQAWAAAQDRPIYLGEFGAYDHAEMESRLRYTGFVAREAERLGWSWAYWQFDSDFVVYDIEHDRWVEPLRDALILQERI
jgi:endoglucanase